MKHHFYAFYDSKLKGIDGGAPPGEEPAVQLDSTPENLPEPTA